MQKGGRLKDKLLKPHSLLIGLIILLIPLLFIGGYYSLTGLVVYDIYVNQTFNESTNLSLSNVPLSFGLNGKILEGAARIYLANDTILDSSLLTNSTFSDYCLGSCVGGSIELRIEIENGTLYLEGLNDKVMDETPFWDSILEEFVVAVDGVLVVDLNDHFTDNESTELVYLTTSSSYFNISITGSIMTIVPIGNSSVSENITIIVSDMKNTLRKEIRVRSDFIDDVRQEVLNSPIVLDDEVVSGLEVSPEISVIVPSTLKEFGLIEKPSDEFIVGMEYDYSSGRNLSKLNIMSMKITRSGLEKLKKNKMIKGVFLDKEFDVAVSDGLRLINAVEASRISTGGVGVCLLDTGVNFENLTGYNFVDDNLNISDDNGHGTLAASVVKATAPDASIIAVKVCNANGKCLASDVLEGLNYCLEEKVRLNISVVSGSFGDKGEYTSESCPSDFGDTFDILDKTGIVSIFSAGNERYRDGVNFPACDPAVIGVGGSDKRDGIALFSNLVNGLLLAPGQDLNISGVTVNGTSFSTAFVSGGAAMLKDVNESLNTASVYTTLFESGKRIGNYSRIDLLKALENITYKEVFFIRHCDSNGNCLVQSERDLLYPCYLNESVIVCPALADDKDYRKSLSKEQQDIYLNNGVPVRNHYASDLLITIIDNNLSYTEVNSNATFYLNPEFSYNISIDLGKQLQLEIGFDEGG